jgi:malonate-semialdehyde dehydrogenase (acetylating) / methylmalonate-semialdehyde dehydrogenase
MAQVEDKPGIATRTLKNYIGGRWVEADGAETIEITNPANGEVLGHVPLSGASVVDEAVRAAREAFPGWRATPPVERARVCFDFKYRLEEAKDDLAMLVTIDNGKAIKDATGEVRRGLECVEVATGIPSLMQGANLEDVSRGIDSDMLRQPIGVFAGITPFNFPFMVPLWFLPFAIACGNTFILKPSEQDPLAVDRVFELLDSIESLPPGVVNLVHGGKPSVDSLLEHPEVDGVSFVGSTPVAHHIYETSAKHGKRVQALGGAKNHVIVMPDAELDAAVDGVLSSAFHAAGQRCLANSVCIAVGDAYGPLKAALAEKGGAMVVGEGADPETEVGPVISGASYERILGWIEKGAAEGEVVLDGRGRGSDDGHFIGPTIIEAEPGSEIAREEIFGPVLTLLKAADLSEALEILNSSTKGNAASIFTTSGGAMRRFRYEAEAGMLGVNIGVAAPMAFFPFTGWKDSFFGDLHAHGRDAIDFYTEKKVVITRWPKIQ